MAQPRPTYIKFWIVSDSVRNFIFPLIKQHNDKGINPPENRVQGNGTDIAARLKTGWTRCLPYSSHQHKEVTNWRQEFVPNAHRLKCFRAPALLWKEAPLAAMLFPSDLHQLPLWITMCAPAVVMWEAISVISGSLPKYPENGIMSDRKIARKEKTNEFFQKDTSGKTHQALRCD